MGTTKSTYSARLDELERQIGDGTISMVYAVNQPYAAYQHVHHDLRHPRGGGPDYVSLPLKTRHTEWLRKYAQALLGGSQVRVLADAGEDLDSYVAVLAPIDTGNLRGSGSIQVIENGAPVYFRAARVPRLDR